MSEQAERRAREFLAIADQFKLGVLLTESSHPVTADLSEVAKESVPDALQLLFQVDQDVLARFRQWVEDGSTAPVAECVIERLKNGGRVFFTGCGSTGRLSILLESVWRKFWQHAASSGLISTSAARDLANRVLSAMAGGDFALIKAVEGFEDFTQFGRRQLADLGIGPQDVLFAITEGGETSWVIGTAWEGFDRGAVVYFVYNNPDDLLVAHVERSRQVIQEPGIRKINLTTGPMAITGSTRMQATSIQLCVLLTVLEFVIRRLLRETALADDHQHSVPPAESASEDFLTELEAVMRTLRSAEVVTSLAELVQLEENIYRNGRRTTYVARDLAVDVLTDTTERSPTFCTPPFRRYDDTAAAESWTFLTVPLASTEEAWRFLLARDPRCVHWSEEDVRAMVPPEKAYRTWEIIQRIGTADLFRFRIGLDGVPYRQLGSGDAGIAIVGPGEADAISPDGYVTETFRSLIRSGAATGLVQMYPADNTGSAEAATEPASVLVTVPVPASRLMLNGATRVGIKMLLNALSTCTMVRLGRVMGNYMVWVVASNLKLIDRATRYISRLTDLPYDDACRLLFDSLEYVAPRMLSDKAYPPVVWLSVLRAKHNISPEEAEKRLWQELGR